MIKVRHMCGGGSRTLRKKFWWRYPGYQIEWDSILKPCKVDGALIWDWPGIAIAWRGDWG